MCNPRYGCRSVRVEELFDEGMIRIRGWRLGIKYVGKCI